MNRMANTLLAVTAVLMANLALAYEYNASQTGRSSITFVVKEMGVPVAGGFRKFGAQLAFNPAKPETAKVNIDIDLASIDAGSNEANDEVIGKQWFNTRAFPTARFTSIEVKALGAGHFQVSGKLTIKGVTRNVTVPFTFRAEDGTGVFDANFVLKRTDYAIGEGKWADFDTVANEILIKIHLLSSSISAKK